jgi:transmembrane sensor
MKNSVTATVSHAHRRKARAEASAWVVQLHGAERSAAMEAAFRAWLSADPEHRREFERVNQVWLEVPEIPLGGITRLTHWHRPRVASRWAIAAAVLLTFGVGVFGVYQVWFAGAYNTGVGEQRVVRLQDGTRVTLNSDSRVVVQFAKNERHVTLVRGEAYFEVAHNRRRPFIVTVGDHDVTDVGTVFMVRYDNGNTAITLLEGKVTVSARNGQALAGAADLASSAANGTSRQTSPDTSHTAAGEGVPQVVTLIPGERLLLAADGPAKLDEPDIDVVTAWRRGEVVLDRTRLDEAIAEMNPYEVRKLVISSPQIARLEISGIYHVGDGAEFAETIAKLYHLRVTRTNGEILIAPPARPDLTPKTQP